MSIIHASDSKVGIIAIHGFYPAYWVGIHHEWVQPFNYLVEKNINTFFYKYNWNECPGDCGAVTAVLEFAVVYPIFV